MLSFLMGPAVMKRILEHLGLEMRPLPLAPARLRDRDLWEWEDSEDGIELEG